MAGGFDYVNNASHHVGPQVSPTNKKIILSNHDQTVRIHNEHQVFQCVVVASLHDTFSSAHIKLTGYCTYIICGLSFSVFF